MSLIQSIVAAPMVVASREPEGLKAIHRDECAASIWMREPSAAFQNWIDMLDPQKLSRARIILQPDAVQDAMTQICQQFGTPDCAEREQLIGDTAALAMIFADLMDTSYIRFRLDAVDTNACRKFHIDALTARLICTYRGTGTQYGVGDHGVDPEEFATLPNCCPIVLRGTQWPITATPGLLHRSPPIEGTGETRLVLVLDPVANPNQDRIDAQIH